MEKSLRNNEWGKRERIVLDRRAFLQFSGASLAACGLGLALNQPARAEIADPADESPDSFTIDDFIERIDNPEIEQYASTGTLPLWIASAFSASLSRLPLPVSIADFVKSPSVISENIWSRLPESIRHAGSNRIVSDWIYRQVWDNLPQSRRDYYSTAGSVQKRPWPEAFRVYKTIPLQIVMDGEQALSKFHQNKHWSHIVPKSKGGSSLASNGIFEYYLYNLWRGDETMSEAELERAKWELDQEAKRVRFRHLAHGQWKLAKSQVTPLREALSAPVVRRTLIVAARPILPAASALTAVEVALAVLDEGLKHQGDGIDWPELWSNVFARVGKDAFIAVVVFGIILGLVMVVPALGALLTSLAPVLLVTTFVLYGYRFYTLSAEWVKQSGFEPVIAAWNETKEIPKQAWAQAANSFKSFQKATREASERALRSAGDASERAWQDIGEFSDSAWQGIGAVPGSVIQGTQGITARTWQGVEFFPNGTLESIGDFSAGAWQGAGSATQSAVQVTTETTSGAWEWVTVTSDGTAVDVTGVPEHVLDWFRDTVLPWLGERVSPAVFWK